MSSETIHHGQQGVSSGICTMTIMKTITIIMRGVFHLQICIQPGS